MLTIKDIVFAYGQGEIGLRDAIDSLKSYGLSVSEIVRALREIKKVQEYKRFLDALEQKAGERSCPDTERDVSSIGA